MLERRTDYYQEQFKEHEILENKLKDLELNNQSIKLDFDSEYSQPRLVVDPVLELRKDNHSLQESNLHYLNTLEPLRGGADSLRKKSLLKPLQNHLKRISLVTNRLERHISIGMFFKIKKYVVQFLLSSQRYRFKSLNAHFYKFFNDKSLAPFQANAYQRQQSQSSRAEPNAGAQKNLAFQQFVLRLRALVEKHQDKVPLFLPSHNLYLAWDFVHILVIIFVFFMIPIQIGFQIDGHNDAGGTFVILVFVLECLISLNTTYYEKGRLIVDRLMILQHYWRKKALQDLVTILPLIFDTFYVEKNPRVVNPLTFLKIFFYLKFYHFSRLKKKLSSRFYQKPNFQNIFSLSELFFTIIFVLHLFACLWVSRRGSIQPARPNLIDESAQTPLQRADPRF